MSILHAFDPDSPEILKASDVKEDVGGPAKGKTDFPETVLVTFSEKLIDVVRERYDAEEIGFLYEGVCVPIYGLTIPQELCGEEALFGRKVAVFRSGIGAPMAVGLLEEVIARGAKRFIVFGSCGVLVPGIGTGHLIVPTEAYRDEGTSYHYMEPSDYVAIRNAGIIAEIFSTLDIPHRSGRIWTTDALYRETVGKADARREEGCIAVDMECAALQAACNFRGVELYQFVYGEDSLENVEWDARNMGRVTQDEYDMHLRIALSLASRV